MNIKLKNYSDAANGISLQLIPETDIEEELLRGIFAHGKMKTGHSCNEKGSAGFYLDWKQEKASVIPVNEQLPEEG